MTIRNKKKIIRSVTVPLSIGFFEEVMMKMKEEGYETVIVTSPGNELDNFKQRYPLERTIELPMERRISIFKDMKSLWRMVNVLRKEKPYIVHSMTPKAGLVTIIAAWLTGVPIRIHTFTGLVWPTASGIKKYVLMFADWLICMCASHIIPEGQGVLNDLRNHKVCRKQMKVLGYGNVKGVDMKRFDPARFAYVEKEDSRFRFIFVGRVVGDKGVNELVKAFDRLNKEYPFTKLTIVGAFEENLDPLKDETLQLIQYHNSIQLCGAKYGDDLLEEYVKSDCYVLPSYREGFPNTVMEAGAMGLPSIVTDINGSREIIISGENGLIVKPKDIDSLYMAMRELLLNTNIRAKMAKNARMPIESRFEKNFVQKCLIDYYKEITKN